MQARSREARGEQYARRTNYHSTHAAGDGTILSCVTRWALAAAIGLLALNGSSWTQSATAPLYEAYAVRFGVLPAYPVSGLVAGADQSRNLDIPVMVWLLKGANGHRVLVDAGFYRQKFVERWKLRDFRTPAEAVEAAGVKPEDVTDIIVSHARWDHVDGADLFPKATVWIQKEEYRYYTGEAWQPRGMHGGIDEEDMLALLSINTKGRLRFVDGDDQEIIPGIHCYTGGRHTWASQYVTAHTDAGTILLASDNVYLYENLEKRVAIAQTLDGVSNLAAQDRMRSLVSDARLIVPGHDPAVFDRFPSVGNGIVRLK
jgi:glyoxylase-like metal-dependent hydrolase (beta-lactamase superfamily II)